LWRKICNDEGFEECEPWPGFPALPEYFPKRVWPIEHPLTAKLRVQFSQMAALTNTPL
jgi:hypothetical protein